MTERKKEKVKERRRGRAATMVMGESHGMGRSELKIETHRSCRGRGANRSILHNALHRLHRDSAGATRLSRAPVSLPKEHSSKMKSLECSPPI